MSALHLLGPFFQAALSGELRLFQTSVFAVGILLLFIGRSGRLSNRVRSALLLMALSTSLLIIFLQAGYAPVVTVSYIFLLVVSGLLSGRVAMGLVLLALPVVFVLSGFAVDMGWIYFSRVFNERDLFRGWLRVTVFLVAVLGCLSLIIQDLSQYIGRTLLHLKKRQREVERSRAAMTEIRNARITAEQALLKGQKSESIARLGHGLAQHFSQRIHDVRGLMEAGIDSTSMPERRIFSEAVSSAFLPSVQIINDLMMLSRSSEPNAWGGCELSEVVKTVCRSAEARQLHSTAAVTLQLQPGLEVVGSKSSIQQAVLNLLLNAHEATPAGTIQVSTIYAQPVNGSISHAMLVVEDTGHGITTDNLALVLEPFFSTRACQTGLGLSVALAIAEQSSGELRLESAPSIGTRVEMTFGLCQPVDASTLSAHTSATHTSLHPEGSLQSVGEHYDIKQPPADEQEASVELSSWQLKFARRMTRAVGLLVLIVLSIHLSIAPRMHFTMYLSICPCLALLLWTGFSSSAKPALVFPVLLFGTFLPGLIGVIFNGYDNPVTISAIAMAIVWSVLLQRYRSTALMMVALIVGFLLTGWHHQHYGILPPLDRLSMNLSNSWYRMAPQVFLLLLALGMSVVGVLERLRLSVQQTASVLQQAEQLRLYEAREAHRLIALEAYHSQQERIEATSRFAGSIAHDLRNTLQLILNVEIIDMEILPADEVQEVLEDIETGLKDVETLAARLLTASSEGAYVGIRERCLLGRQVRQTMRQLRQFLPEGIAVETDIEECGVVTLSPTDVRRMLNNLINNSCDAMCGEGLIWVGLRRTDSTAELSVRDNGPGIDADIAAQVFEPYFSTKSQTTGTGLGLHAVQSIMSRCSGQVSVVSTPGEGAIFKLLFPVQASSPQGAPGAISTA